MKTLQDIKFYINRFQQNALSYIYTILQESCNHVFTDYDANKDVLKSRYKAKDIDILINEDKKGFSILAFKNHKEIFKKVM